MSRPERPAELDGPIKPTADMTPEERAEYIRGLRSEARRILAELSRPARERKLRQGIAKPRNRREWELFASDHLPPEETGE